MRFLNEILISLELIFTRSASRGRMGRSRHGQRGNKERGESPVQKHNELSPRDSESEQVRELGQEPERAQAEQAATAGESEPELVQPEQTT